LVKISKFLLHFLHFSFYYIYLLILPHLLIFTYFHHIFDFTKVKFKNTVLPRWRLYFFTMVKLVMVKNRECMCIRFYLRGRESNSSFLRSICLSGKVQIRRWRMNGTEGYKILSRIYNETAMTKYCLTGDTLMVILAH
jgi:hypothetical protein